MRQDSILENIFFSMGVLLVGLHSDSYHENPSKFKNEYVFKNPNTENVWSSETIGLRWNETLKALNIPHRSAYETRHTFASIMVTACLPDGWVRRQMGHSTMKMLEEVYAKWLDDADKVIDWVLKNTKDGHNGAQFKKLFLDQHNKVTSV